MSKSKILSRSFTRLIEVDEFPFEFLSALAERESWRKEVHRPIYHIHKWWAKRLGSIFRGIILGCVLPVDATLEQYFYEKHSFQDIAVFDPFMGSGTTVGEAHKLGCISLGRDINPVACESVRVALGPLDRGQIQTAFERLSETVGNRIQALYQSRDNDGQLCDVLYFFWVKQVPCHHCSANVDLFATRIIARNAYPNRKPEVRVCCPGCGDIFTALHTDKLVTCGSCALTFDPSAGNANGAKATCPTCTQVFSISHAIRAVANPPAHRLYAKLLLTPRGEKVYLPTNHDDFVAYRECSALLGQELARGAIRLPETCLDDGFNTRQAIGYNYRKWRDFFNDRQLLALGWLQEAIARIADIPTRDALLTIFSGALEFNNLFTSYKGEGTGAVRHMFAHHILKPERMPIEANIWGTSKSSGSFLNLFKNRLIRTLDYRDAPFEVTKNGSGKAYFTSTPFSGKISSIWPNQEKFESNTIYLSCGSSDKTDLSSQSVDLIVTDPPFFDNVHYSELADFFYAWQKLNPRGFLNGAATTRHTHEVQDTNADKFATKLRAVFLECHRVLKDEGVLVFSYHHSRADGWVALLDAVVGAGFSIINAHPVKAEMSVAAPKSQAKEPIQLDVIIVCKKMAQDSRSICEPSEALGKAIHQAVAKLNRLTFIGLKLSRNDRRVVIFSQFIAALGPFETASAAVNTLMQQQASLEAVADEITLTIPANLH